MDDKKAAEILLKLQEKYPLTEEEKEALSAAIGVLSWTSLAESRLKQKKAKREKDMEI